MSNKNVYIAFAVAVALVLQLSSASTVTLTGGCPSYIINSSNSYIAFNVTNTGNGAASDLTMSISFQGLSAANSTQVIALVSPNSSYTRKFPLSNVIGLGSYAVNVNATYVQSGSTYGTVFPCIVHIGSLAGGPLVAVASVKGNRLYLNVTNNAQQEIQANVVAVVPPGFKVANSTEVVNVPSNGKADVYFDVASPSYTDASFPLTGELSYEYQGYHYAQIASAAIVFGSSGTGGGSGILGIGIVGLALIAIVVVILALIVLSVIFRRKGKPGSPLQPDAQTQEVPHQ